MQSLAEMMRGEILLTPRTLAMRWGVSHWVLSSMRRKGKVPRGFMVNGHRRWTLQEIKAWEERQRKMEREDD